MKLEDINQKDLENGLLCRKKVPYCMCLVGYPFERLCPDCRDTRQEGDNSGYCVCGPKE